MEKKKLISLLLALAMVFSLSVTVVSADEVGSLAGETVTLTLTPEQETICVGSTTDVYVGYTISIAATAPIPAFSFVLKDGHLATGVTDDIWKFQIEKANLMQEDELDKKTEGYKGPYHHVDYTPSSGYMAAAGSNPGAGIESSTTIMTTVAKFAKGSVSAETTYQASPTDFIAGGGDTYQSGNLTIANKFGTCSVVSPVITVKPGTTISGTVTDEGGAPVNGAAMELYMDGKKVADGVTSDSSGNYTFTNVSTGTYTVKAKGSGVSGSADVTVTDGALTAQDVSMRQYQKGDVNMDGEVDAEDATLVLRHIAHIENITDSTASELADVDNSGAVDAEDATKLLRYIAHIDLTLG